MAGSKDDSRKTETKPAPPAQPPAPAPAAERLSVIWLRDLKPSPGKGG